MTSILVRCAAVSFIVVAPLRGQAFLWKLDGNPATNVEFGYRVVGIGDVDVDGADDFVATDPQTPFSGGAPSGSLFVYSGRSQSLLWSASGSQSGAYLGEGLARIGDIDGDGFEEFAITTERGGVDVYSAKQGTVLYSIPVGFYTFGYVANAGDIDLDGIPEIVVGGIGGYSLVSTHAAVYSGRTGANLYDWPSVGGQSMAGGGDIDGDGVGDVIVGDPFASRGGHLYNGCVFLFSGQNGSLIREIDGTGDGQALGIGLRGGHDIDGDGIPDWLSDTGLSGFTYAYSGATGNEITSWTAVRSGFDDSQAAFEIDFDKDGVTDILQNDGSTIRLISGRTWLDDFRLQNVRGSLAAGDFNGDGFVDILVGDYLDSPNGALFAYSGAIPPRVTGIQPNRARYGAPANVTITGSMFLVGSNVQVFFDSIAATNVTVVNDSTITCTAPAGVPGPVDVTVQDSAGSAVLDSGFTYTPAVLWDGSASPGGSVTLHYLCDPLDGILAIVGTTPVSIPTPPYSGTLGISPFEIIFVVPVNVWPSDQFDLSGSIPNDPSLVGVTFLLQALDGPSFAAPKDAAWTNVRALTIH